MAPIHGATRSNDEQQDPQENKPKPKARPAEIVREYGFPGADDIAGVTHDGQRVWAATGAS
jgi:hypothetical protein